MPERRCPLCSQAVNEETATSCPSCGFPLDEDNSKIIHKKQDIEKNQEERLIRVAILAEEPLGWGSGKHFFPIIFSDKNLSMHRIIL